MVLNPPEIIGGTALVSEEIRLNRPGLFALALDLRTRPPSFALQISARHRELAGVQRELLKVLI